MPKYKITESEDQNRKMSYVIYGSSDRTVLEERYAFMRRESGIFSVYHKESGPEQPVDGQYDPSGYRCTVIGSSEPSLEKDHYKALKELRDNGLFSDGDIVVVNGQAQIVSFSENMVLVERAEGFAEGKVQMFDIEDALDNLRLDPQLSALKIHVSVDLNGDSPDDSSKIMKVSMNRQEVQTYSFYTLEQMADSMSDTYSCKEMVLRDCVPEETRNAPNIARYELTKDMYDDIRRCMDNDCYRQTVEAYGGEPTRPDQYKAFLDVYLHVDQTDRNAEARKEALAQDGPDAARKIPLKYFTDVVREETGIVISADSRAHRTYMRESDATAMEQEESRTKSEDERMPASAASSLEISIEESGDSKEARPEMDIPIRGPILTSDPFNRNQEPKYKNVPVFDENAVEQIQNLSEEIKPSIFEVSPRNPVLDYGKIVDQGEIVPNPAAPEINVIPEMYPEMHFGYFPAEFREKIMTGEIGSTIDRHVPGEFKVQDGSPEVRINEGFKGPQKPEKEGTGTKEKLANLAKNNPSTEHSAKDARIQRKDQELGG